MMTTFNMQRRFARRALNREECGQTRHGRSDRYIDDIQGFDIKASRPISTDISIDISTRYRPDKHASHESGLEELQS
jgi:hypothetical protein